MLRGFNQIIRPFWTTSGDFRGVGDRKMSYVVHQTHRICILYRSELFVRQFFGCFAERVESTLLIDNCGKAKFRGVVF